MKIIIILIIIIVRKNCKQVLVKIYYNQIK